MSNGFEILGVYAKAPPSRANWHSFRNLGTEGRMRARLGNARFYDLRLSGEEERILEPSWWAIRWGRIATSLPSSFVSHRMARTR